MPTAAAGGNAQTSTPFLGKDLPLFNPGSEIVSWDGRNWNVDNQRFFQARFEKYLNAPEETAEADVRYQSILRGILEKLAPETFTRANLVEAWRLLPEASNFTLDASLCDTLADAVYSCWAAKREQDRLAEETV